MSVLKKIAKTVGVAIFLLTLSSAIFASSLAEFTRQDVMKPVVVDTLTAQLEKAAEKSGYTQSEYEKIQQTMSDACSGRESIEVPFSDIGEFGSVTTITINCTELGGLPAGPTSIKYLFGLVAESIFDGIYFKQYDCEFMYCLKRGDFLVAMSAQGNEFFNSIRLALWVGVAVGTIMILSYSEGWPDRLKGLGWPMIFTGVSYFFIGFVKSMIIDNFPVVTEAKKAGIDITGPIDAVINPTMTSLLILLAVGAIITVAGYALGHYEHKKESEMSEVKIIKFKK
jgi:hypothetical protein